MDAGQMTRDEAIEILKELWRYEKTAKYNDAQIRKALDVAIEALEQPEIIRCEDCKHSKPVDSQWIRCELSSCKLPDFYCASARRREE